MNSNINKQNMIRTVLRRTFVFLLISLIFSGLSIAKPIDQNTAKQAALNFLANEVFYTPIQPLTLVNAVATSVGNTAVGQVSDGYYIFGNDNCFVIISADDAAKPILAYSTESGFGTNNVSPEVNYMLGLYKQQINFIQSNQVAATDEITKTWTGLINNTNAQSKTATWVKALMTTTWDQAPYYNDLCPYDNNYQQLTVTGCVATAMAQVLKFWNYPATGSQSNSYYDNPYGDLSFAFQTTTFNWDSMPAKITGHNSSIATLMFACGVAVDMSYGVGATGGSGAYVIPPYNGSSSPSALIALVHYFKYNNQTIKGYNRSDTKDFPTDNSWRAMLQNEISNGRPVIYAGSEASGAGHCFDFDGFNTQNGLFHVNWGWSGAYNGFFAIDSLNPSGVGIGGGTGQFNLRQQAIIGILPASMSENNHNSGIQNVSAPGNLSIYPNPARNSFIADLTNFDGTPQMINIIDIQGKQVNSVVPVSNSKMTINTSNIPDGVYVVQIISDKGITNSKIVVQK